MKRINHFMIGLTAIALAAAGCSRTGENIHPFAGEKNGSLTVTVKSENMGSRTVTDLDDATVAAAILANESQVIGYTVYVFDWQTGIYETKADGVLGTPTLITGLSTAGSKRVAVLANKPSALNFAAGDTFDKFQASTSMYDITTQSAALAATNGLLMSGEYGTTPSPVPLTPGVDNPVSITIKRVASKVVLKSITVSTDESAQFAANFTVTGVGIQRALATVSPGPTTITQGTAYYDGLPGGSLTSMTLQTALFSDLYETTPAPITFSKDIEVDMGNYYYVWPDNDPNYCTLLTIRGIYNDGTVAVPSNRTVFFPIKINPPADANNTGVDGSYVVRNTIYTLDVTIKNPSLGTADPDMPADPANLKVDVTVADWATLNQSVTW